MAYGVSRAQQELLEKHSEDSRDRNTPDMRQKIAMVVTACADGRAAGRVYSSNLPITHLESRAQSLSTGVFQAGHRAQAMLVGRPTQERPEAIPSSCSLGNESGTELDTIHVGRLNTLGQPTGKNEEQFALVECRVCFGITAQFRLCGYVSLSLG